MRSLLNALPTEAFILQLPPHVLVGPQTQIPGLGYSQISMVDAMLRFSATTVDGYSITRDYARRGVPEPTALKARLLALYHAALRSHSFIPILHHFVLGSSLRVYFFCSGFSFMDFDERMMK